MKRNNFFKCIAVTCSSLFISGCVSTCATTEKQDPPVQVQPEKKAEPPKEIKKVEEPKKVEPPKKVEEPKKEEPPKKVEEPKKVEPPKKVEEPKKEEPKKEEPPKKVEEPKKEEKHSEEYTRSIQQIKGAVNISEKTFTEDKKEVLAMIDELNGIMKNEDYKSWIEYIDDESIRYWSQKSNLQKASKRLPIKGIQINTMEDYFRYLFIPSRVGRNVDEIRYLTETSVKAVQVKKDEENNVVGDTVYYNLKKVGGKWKLHLPTL